MLRTETICEDTVYENIALKEFEDWNCEKSSLKQGVHQQDPEFSVQVITTSSLGGKDWNVVECVCMYVLVVYSCHNYLDGGNRMTTSSNKPSKYFWWNTNF